LHYNSFFICLGARSVGSKGRGCLGVEGRGASALVGVEGRGASALVGVEGRGESAIVGVEGRGQVPYVLLDLRLRKEV
jgi:hypothetical protein